METKRKPFEKESGKRIPFEDLIRMIGHKCDYKFAIIDYEVDDELKDIAKMAGINLDGYKHVIETTGISHSHNRHGEYHKTFIYRKTIGEQYVYVEEIRIGRNKSLAFQTLYKRPIKKPPL